MIEDHVRRPSGKPDEPQRHLRSEGAIPDSVDAAAVAHTRAWLFLVAALALHVTDEALTDFLDFYNPLVLRIRAEIPWFPMPTFAFTPWLAGLVLLVVALAALATAVRRGGRLMWLASWVLSAIMLANGVAHLAGSWYFGRWLPGATSAPFLIVASVLLMRTAWRRGPVSQPARS